MKVFLLLYMILVCPMILLSQESPPIMKFPPNEYKAENQNWAITQDQNKRIYIANNEGLLEYNGADWTLYPSPNNTIVRSVLAVKDRIYTGSYMEFGYWARMNDGKLAYHSLSDTISTDLVEDENIWNIKSLDNWIIFQSYDRMYFYDVLSGSIKYSDDEKKYYRIFKIKNEIFIHEQGGDIYKIEKGEEQLFAMVPKDFDVDFVLNIFPEGNDLIFITKNRGFFRIRNGTVAKWQIQADEDLSQMEIYSCIRLKDGTFLLGTISKGIIQMSSTGLIMGAFNQFNGLSNNTALNLYEDLEGNVWAALDNGIDCLNIQSYISEYNDASGSLGTTYCSTVFKGLLYIGTNQGLFYKDVASNKPLKLVTGTKGQVWSLFNYDEKLFCGHNNGAFIIDRDTASPLATPMGIWGFKAVPNNPQILMIGHYSGLSIIAKENGVWRYRNDIKGFANSARFFEFSGNLTMFVNHEYKGVYRLQLNKANTAFDEVDLLTDIPKGKNSGLLKFGKDILYAYEKGIFRLGSSTAHFKKDTLLSKLIPDTEYVSGKLQYDSNEMLWAFNKNSINYAKSGLLDNDIVIKSIPIKHDSRKGTVSFENITRIKDNRYILGKTNGFLIVDLNKLPDNYDHNVLLNKVVMKQKDTSSLLVPLNHEGAFNYSQRSLQFHYSVPNYHKFENITFQYKLEGFQDKWSEWEESTNASFEKLPFGDYSFKVRSKTSNQISKNIASYSFTVARPIYGSNLAIAGYFLFAIVLGFLTHKTYNRYYKKQHQHVIIESQREMEMHTLKSEQEIIKLKNEKLTHEIESKNRELAISTMSIVKKNEVLRDIKKELVTEAQDADNKNNSVLVLIDKNLNNSKDWNLFKEAFNNADKDFLKRMKKTHPGITHNDLKFCTYLRLNLSSKEIAPLLNITLKSLEIRRYRLRKKMELPPERNLTDYILDF